MISTKLLSLLKHADSTADHVTSYRYTEADAAVAGSASRDSAAGVRVSRHCIVVQGCHDQQNQPCIVRTVLSIQLENRSKLIGTAWKLALTAQIENVLLLP